MRERFERMIAYADNEQECRSVVLEHYFGADDATPCGVCDLCLARKRAAREAARKEAEQAAGAAATAPAGAGENVPHTPHPEAPKAATAPALRQSGTSSAPPAQHPEPAQATGPRTLSDAASDTAPAAPSLACRLLERLAAGPASPRTLAEACACPPERLAETLRPLLDAGRIRTTEDGLLRLADR